MLPLALGTQTVGSILRPSGFCGAVGYKPSRGALPTAGLHPLSRTLDHLGPIAGSVEDACAAVQIMQDGFGGDAAGAIAWAGDDASPRAPVRLARIRIEDDAALEPSASEAFEGYLDSLREGGVQVVGAADDAGVAELEALLAGANMLCMNILRYEMRWPLEEYAGRGAHAVGPRIREHLAEAKRVTLQQYREALSQRDALRQQVARIALDLDGFVLPAASGVAPEGLAFTGDRTMLAPWSVVGGPAWSLPLLAVDGLPFGVQLAGAPGSDQGTARIARWLTAA
jgi:Asp-tRNA(Asn)/Glu-tRNA(Gln) amidotransferase A subunit family amidase